MSQVPIEVLSDQDVQRLIADPDTTDAFGIRDAAILATLYYAVATAVELVALDTTDIDLEGRSIRMKPDDGRPRRIALEEPLVELLRLYMDESRKLLLAHGGITGDAELPAMFVTNKGHRIHVQDVRQILGTHSKAAGIGAHVNYNTLRLSRAWHLREAGESPEMIQRLLGASGHSGRSAV